ncbi:MAG: hypothetical protein ACEQSA_06495 [Weeksellaceae bacterium]
MSQTQEEIDRYAANDYVNSKAKNPDKGWDWDDVENSFIAGVQHERSRNQRVLTNSFNEYLSTVCDTNQVTNSDRLTLLNCWQAAYEAGRLSAMEGK